MGRIYNMNISNRAYMFNFSSQNFTMAETENEVNTNNFSLESSSI
jgi:hypothetical protein